MYKTLLGQRLKELRGTSSQSEMADAIGIKWQSWARYERGDVAPGAEILANICRVHACSADWLLGISNKNDLSAAKPPSPTINLEELRNTASQLADEAAALSGTIKKLKKML